LTDSTQPEPGRARAGKARRLLIALAGGLVIGAGTIIGGTVAKPPVADRPQEAVKACERFVHRRLAGAGTVAVTVLVADQDGARGWFIAGTLRTAGGAGGGTRGSARRAFGCQTHYAGGEWVADEVHISA
jgi:hypothetical protein